MVGLGLGVIRLMVWAWFRMRDRAMVRVSAIVRARFRIKGEG